MVEENDYNKYEDPEELRREIQVRITKLDELERAISGEKCKSKDPSFPQIDLQQLISLDEKQLAQLIEELDKSVDWEKLSPKQAEDLSKVYAELLRLRKSQLKGFEDETFWFWKYKKGDTKEIITSTQEVIRSLSNVVIGNTHAIALSFKYHSELAEFSNFLLYLGCYNIAMNVEIVNDLNDALEKKETIDKKEWSKKTKERVKEIIHHLKDQQNVLQKQNALAEKQAFLQKELEKKIDKQAFNDEIAQFVTKSSHYADIETIQNKLTQISITLKVVDKQLEDFQNKQGEKLDKVLFDEVISNYVKCEEYKNRVTKLEFTLKIIWITYGFTTAALLAGLIASFLI